MAEKKITQNIIKYFAICIETVLLIMTVVIGVRFVSYVSVTKLGVENDTLIKWSKGVDLSATVTGNSQDDTNPIYRIQNKINRYTKMVESFCTVSFPLSGKANRTVGWLNKNVFHNNLSANPGIYGVSAPATKAADDLYQFMNYLDSQSIPHVYVHTPYIEYYKYCNNQEELIERWDTVNGRERFLQELDSHGMEYIDIYKDKGSYEFTFDSSNHWQSKDALFAAQMTTDWLNEKYGMGLDTRKLIPDLYVNAIEDNVEFKSAVDEIEGFNWQYLIPKDQGYYTLLRENIEKTGYFSNCFVNTQDQWRTSADVYHNVCGLNNGKPYFITNHNMTDGSKCLIIGDSFAWPFYSYMAQEFNSVTAVWNNDEEISYYDYINEWKPDVVIVILNDCQLSGNYHFDFNK